MANEDEEEDKLLRIFSNMDGCSIDVVCTVLSGFATFDRQTKDMIMKWVDEEMTEELQGWSEEWYSGILRISGYIYIYKYCLPFSLIIIIIFGYNIEG